MKNHFKKIVMLLSLIVISSAAHADEEVTFNLDLSIQKTNVTNSVPFKKAFPVVMNLTKRASNTPLNLGTYSYPFEVAGSSFLLYFVVQHMRKMQPTYQRYSMSYLLIGADNNPVGPQMNFSAETMKGINSDEVFVLPVAIGTDTFSVAIQINDPMW